MDSAEKLRPIAPLVVGQIVGYVGRTPERPKPSLSSSRWHVVTTEPQQERSVEEDFEQLGIAAYVPREPKSVKVNAVLRATQWRPMLPCYLFAGFDVTADLWRLIPGIRHVRRLFMINFRPVPIGEKEMQVLRQAEVDASQKKQKPPRLMCNIGDLVQIQEGPFASFFGFVTAIDHKKRIVKVEVDIFGRKTPAEFVGDQLQIVA